MNIPDTDKILDTHHFNIDIIRDMALQIEWKYANLFNDPPYGIYASHRHDPICDLSVPLFQRDPISEEYFQVLLEEATGHLYSIDEYKISKMIVPKSWLSKRNRLVDTKPFHPYVGFRVISTLIYQHLASASRFAITHPFDDVRTEELFYSNFRDVDPQVFDPMVFEAKDRIYLDCISICANLFDQIDVFIKGYEWHIHSLVLTPTYARMSRHMDHRAFLYEHSRFQQEVLRSSSEDEVSG